MALPPRCMLAAAVCAALLLTATTIRLHNPNPGQDPQQPPAPAPGEVPSPVRDVPPNQPVDPVPNQPIDTPPYQPTDPIRTR